MSATRNQILVTGMNPQIAYITLNGRIPSTTANSVGVMTMCGHFSAIGLRTLLIVPGGQTTDLDELGHSGDVLSFYSVRAPFELKYFPNAFSGRLSYLSFSYSLALVLYARARGVELITTRNVEVAVWAAWFGMPVILESHNFSKFSINRWIGRWVKMAQDPKRMASMIVTTRAGMDSYVKLGVPENRIKVLPNGVAVERFASEVDKKTLRTELGLPLNTAVAAFSGSLHEGRGGEEMLECARLLPDIHFLIVGGTAEQVARFRRLAQEQALRNVTFTGHVSQGTLPRYLLAADFLLMPYTTRFSAHSFEYTSPMKMFEYLATGRPMVATDFPILHEVLEHGRNAVFVKPDSGAELANGLRFLLSNPDVARRIGENAKVDAQRYSWENRARTVIEWQRELGHLK